MTAVPPVRKFAHWALVASDVERTQRWFAEVLGAIVPPPDANRPACVDLAGTIIDLFPSGGVSPAGIPFKTPAPGSIGQHHAYLIELDDYDSWVAHFEKLGHKYRCAAHPYTLSIYVDDPDGYHIELTVPFDDVTKGRSEMQKRGLM